MDMLISPVITSGILLTARDANDDIPAIPGRAVGGSFSGEAANRRDAKPTCCVHQPSDVTSGGVLAVACFAVV